MYALMYSPVQYSSMLEFNSKQHVLLIFVRLFLVSQLNGGEGWKVA